MIFAVWRSVGLTCTFGLKKTAPAEWWPVSTRKRRTARWRVPSSPQERVRSSHSSKWWRNCPVNSYLFAMISKVCIRPTAKCWQKILGSSMLRSQKTCGKNSNKWGQRAVHRLEGPVAPVNHRSFELAEIQVPLKCWFSIAFAFYKTKKRSW